MFAKIFLVFAIMLLVLGCISPEALRVQSIPEVKAFIEKHPDATISVRKIRPTLLTGYEVKNFKQKCGYEPKDNFYYAIIISKDAFMEVWLDAKSFEPLCIFAGGATRGCQSNRECDDHNNDTFDECVSGECVHRSKTCKELNGKICKKNWLCTKDFFETYDTNRCCSGECIENLCEIVECAFNETCVNGQCVLLPCKDLNGTKCPAMQKCSGTVIQALDTNDCCIAECEQINPCSEVHCPEGMHCREGTCVYS